MKALTLLIWFVAAVLLIGVFKMEMAVSSHANDSVRALPSLLAIAPPTLAHVAVLLPEVVSKPQVSLEPSAGCSRLGVFPRRDWAERVAAILADAPAPEPASESAVNESRHVEEVKSRPWRVQRISLNAYYLQFEAWSIDELAARMTLQRAALKKLLSINAIPEAC